MNVKIMLKDSNSNNVSIDIPTKYIAAALIGLTVLTLGILSFSALGSASLMF